MKFLYQRHRRSWPWLRSSKDGFIYEGILQLHRVHTGDEKIVAYHLTIGPCTWTVAWRRRGY